MRKFKNVILLLVVVLAVFGWLLTKLVPAITEYVKTASEHSTSVKTLEEKQRTLEDMKKISRLLMQKLKKKKRHCLKTFISR